jgi:hypothetical protein
MTTEEEKRRRGRRRRIRERHEREKCEESLTKHQKRAERDQEEILIGQHKKKRFKKHVFIFCRYARKPKLKAETKPTISLYP